MPITSTFVTIDPNKIKIGDPITKDLWDLLKNDLDNLDERITALASVAINITAISGDVSFYGYSASEPDIFYYKVREDFAINEFRVQLFSKQAITTGSLTLRLEKATNTNDANFSTILNTDLTFDFSLDADYSEKVASINSALNNVTIGQVLRIKVMSVPASFSGKILVSLGGQ